MSMEKETTQSVARKWKQVWEGLVFLMRNMKTLKALRQLEQMRSMLVRTNVELGKLTYHDPLYLRRVQEFNQAMIESTRGKWSAARAMDTRKRRDWRQAFGHIRNAHTCAEQIYQALISGDSRPLRSTPARLSSQGTEILFADGIPLIPAINPIVILQGTDEEMGIQYAQQLISIFGPWILQRKAGKSFNAAEREVLQRWEEQLQQHASEILGFCRGWATGATEAGVPMNYEDVLDIWTGHLPPATHYMGRGDGPPQIGFPSCSGVAAWGRATTDGRLVTGSTGDHDPTYMVTIVAFPTIGNSFILTPFSAVGEVPVVGPVWMMGFGGMNNKGLVFVHHGGDTKMIEPKDTWGYGIRKGASIFHILRFANSTREACEMELSFPVGDVGRPSGTAGGFYADRTYGYVLESRKDPVLVREAGMLGETDFLYSANSPMHQDACQAGWMQKNQRNWLWEAQGGWSPRKPAALDLFSSIRRRDPEAGVEAVLNLMYTNSCGRSQYLSRMMSRAKGTVDEAYLKMIYRKSGAYPPGTWEEIQRSYKTTGQWGAYSAGHAGNALVTIMQPDDGPHGRYALCVSTAKRGLPPNLPNPGGGPIYDETNAFWELTLAESPAHVTACARETAQTYLEQARQVYAALAPSDVAYPPVTRLLDQAELELQGGMEDLDQAKRATGNTSLALWAKATRAFTRAQVRALQVSQAVIPPPSSPEELDLE